MTDTDFDELDRAVNSVLGGAVSQEKTASEPAISRDETVSKSDEVNSDTTSTQSEAQPPRASATAKAPFVAKRSSGRFMDVVHPSSDMKVKPTPVVSRHGGVITPLSASTQEPVSSPQAVKKNATELETTFRPVAEKTPEEPQTPEEKDVSLPDPLDFHGFTDEDAADSSDASQDSSEQESKPDTTPALAPEPTPANELDTTAPSSPFLTDAKVEKRPLGGQSDALGTNEQPSDTSTSADIDAVTGEPIAPPTPTAEEALPEELRADVLSVEALESSPTNQPANTDEALQTQPATDTVNEKKPTPETAPAATAAASPLLQSGSITQQYQAKTAPIQQDADDESSVFDTDAYHQALKHPEKKSSGWLSFIIILLLVIIGAGGGVATYFFLNQ